MASTSPQNTDSSKPKSAAKLRKRAPKACLSCRARKVRCDVSQRGRPCMNCYLDSETCVVTGRASRFRRQREGTENVQISYPPYATDSCNHVKTAEAVVQSRNNGQPVSPSSDHGHGASPHGGPAEGDAARPNTAPADDADERPSTAQPQTSADDRHNHHSHRPLPQMNSHRDYPIVNSSNHSTMLNPSGNLWNDEKRSPSSIEVTYSYYPFLTIGNLHKILPQDVNYLDSQGCLRLPTRAVLDDFMQQYFLHAHPLLPFIHEGDFWEMYCSSDSSPDRKMSLLVLQAMMFCSCNFVSRNTIKAMGFPSIRAARAALYRRAKLMYDLDTEDSVVALSQASLLLSFYSPNGSHAARMTNTQWMSSAILHARTAEAPRFAAMPTVSKSADPDLHKKQNTLRRLWWCCVTRDRIVALCMRRSMLITRAHFDFDGNGGLGSTDLADEINTSKVYNPETKRCLIEIFVQIVELCSVLTDLVMLVFPLDDAPGWGKQMGSDELGRVREVKTALRRWYKGATLRFPMFGGGRGPRTASTAQGKERQHDSVILYTNLMYMYYHSSRVALCHHEVLQSAVTSAIPNMNNDLRHFSSIYENRHELQDAASGVTECLKELVQLQLARWLPISAVACTALPLVLHILDAKLSLHSKGVSADPKADSGTKQHRLNILIEAMKTYQPQYDGVDYISETIRHIVTIAQLDPPTQSITDGSGNSSITDWTDILATQPGSYLRLAMTMDLSLSKGRLPEESDFPEHLRGLFVAGFSPIRNLIESERLTRGNASFSLNSYYMPQDMGMSMVPGTVQSMSSVSEFESPGAHGTTMPHPPQNKAAVNGDNSAGQLDIEMGESFMEQLNGEDLSKEKLAAGAMNNVSPLSSSSDGDTFYEDEEDDWIERAWEVESGTPEEDRVDRETARVLLDALKETDLVGCLA